VSGVAQPANVAGTGPNADTLNDQMPNSLSYASTYTVGVNSACAPQPDLVVSALKASNSQPANGTTVKLTATIKNQGAGPAGASKTQFQLDGTTGLGQVNTASLAPGATVQVSVNWTANVTAGQHAIKAIADKSSLVAESNETNNQKTITVTVQ
jgi:subtilase family serine protease